MGMHEYNNSSISIFIFYVIGTKQVPKSVENNEVILSFQTALKWPKFLCQQTTHKITKQQLIR